ncbi:MAG: ABC transporter ATP-binding protein [Olegusella sp.]|nr:ABC transporter ATP-binding protein [Olegusella sp.]
MSSAEARDDELRPEANGAAEVVEADEDTPKDAAGTAKRLWQEAKSERWRLIVATVSATFSVATHLWATTYSGGLIDLLWAKIKAHFVAGTPFRVTWGDGLEQILIYLGIWTLAWALYSIQIFVMASFAERLNLQLRRRISAKVSRLPLSYFDRHQPGDTISRATNDLDKVSEVLQRGVLQLLMAVVSIVGAFSLMFLTDVRLALVFGAFAVATLALTKVAGAKTMAVAARRQNVMGRLTGRIEENYSGRTVVVAYGLEDKTLAEMQADADELARESAHADFLTEAIGPATRFVMRLAQVVVGLLAGSMVVTGQMTVGGFQTFFGYMFVASDPLTQLSMTLNMLQGALAAAERVFALLDAQEAEPDPVEPALPAAETCGRVVFEHVRFGYTPENTLMHDVSFVAEPGQKVAIVGATGAGKTTLINLLMRFYEVDAGRITLDGVDTHKMTRTDLRRQFGMVLQDSWLFEGTIADNIAYGRPDATREEVEAAARAAHVDFFVRTLPRGYDTMVENGGENLSQGQRQLLTIARAMLTDPAILILDEATSSVDTRTEQAIVRAMEAIMEDRTSFVIAHRLSTIVDSDLILVMDHGTIIEQGNHAQLMAAGGAYAELYRSQFA